MNVAIYAAFRVLSNPASGFNSTPFDAEFCNRLSRAFHRFPGCETQGSAKRLWVSFCLLFWAFSVQSPLYANDASAVARGYQNLRNHQYLPPDFDDAVFADLWTVWPEPDRANAEAVDAATRRKLTLSYYGLIPLPGDQNGKTDVLGYVSDDRGTWTMSCLACHGGKVAGRVIPGLPNSHTALQTLADDVRTVKIRQGKPLTHLDLGALQIPLGTTIGTTNSVVFGIILGAYRNPDMTVDLQRKLPPLMHHDMDAPPFWNVRKKRSLYVDGFAPKTARPLMQFIMLPRVTPEQLTEWEPEFADMLAWIESLEAPKYPFASDRTLAARGELIFNQNCARCHGTYGAEGKYDQKTIPIAEVGTDSLRLKSLSPEHRTWMKVGWLSHFGKYAVESDPAGYVAPPLDGIWASAPYFHNGSVPTLWHVLHPDARPTVWKRTEDGYDQQRIGLEVEEMAKIPATVKSPAHQRRYFETNRPGKSAAGHRFPDSLSEDEKQAVLEYLKTL